MVPTSTMCSILFFEIGPWFTVSYFECPRLNFNDVLYFTNQFWTWTLCKFFNFCDGTADIRETIFASAYTYRCQTAGPLGQAWENKDDPM